MAKRDAGTPQEYTCVFHSSVTGSVKQAEYKKPTRNRHQRWQPSKRKSLVWSGNFALTIKSVSVEVAAENKMNKSSRMPHSLCGEKKNHQIIYLSLDGSLAFTTNCVRLKIEKNKLIYWNKCSTSNIVSNSRSNSIKSPNLAIKSNACVDNMYRM